MTNTIRRFAQALGDRQTYRFWRNSYFLFGVLWGIPVPIFALYMDCAMDGPGHSVVEAVRIHPIHWFFLLHPVLFGVIFGALGTIRRHVEESNVGLIGRLKEEAITDPLTGLHNRRYIFDEARKTIFRAKSGGTGVGFIMFDLDGFKAVNDKLGHLAGDHILVRAAKALRSVTRDGDLLARIGGDEFLLVIGEPLDASLPLIVRAAQAVERATELGLSAGTARFPVDGDDIDTLLAAADRRMAETKDTHYKTRGYMRGAR